MKSRRGWLTKTLADALQRIGEPMSEVDRKKRAGIRAGIAGAVAIPELQPRVPVIVAGQITSIRIVPSPGGSPRLEATLSDGAGSVVVIWTGRSHIAGIVPGRRLSVCGCGLPSGPSGRLVFYNPRYELLG